MWCKNLYQGNKEELEKFLDSPIWMCDVGRHTELGKKGDYLKIIKERNEMTKRAEIEPKKENEYTVPELQKEFDTALVHLGLGVFRDLEGNVWDYRLGKEGERFYSKVK